MKKRCLTLSLALAMLLTLIPVFPSPQARADTVEYIRMALADELETVDISGGVEITGFVSGAPVEEIGGIRIPGFINGKRVLRIGNGAFKDNEFLLTVIGVDNWINGTRLEEIGEEAFMNCVNLKSIPVIDLTEAIGKRAFYNTDLSEGVSRGLEFRWSADVRLESIGDEAFANSGITMFNLGTPHIDYVKTGTDIFAGAAGNFRVAIRIDDALGRTVLPDTWRGYPLVSYARSYSFFPRANIGVEEGGIFYPTEAPINYAHCLEDNTAYLDMDAEKLILPPGFAVTAYSIDGGTKWKKGAVPAQSVPKFFNKGFTLHVKDKDDKTLTFPAVEKRPRANPGRLVVNYSICAEYGPTGGWILADKEFEYEYSDREPRDRDIDWSGDVFDYQVAPSANGKTPNQRSISLWGEFSVEGIPVLPAGSPKVTYLARTKPVAIVEKGIYVPASKTFKIKPKTLQKAPKYKPNYKNETLKLKRGDAIFYGDATLVTDGNYDRAGWYDEICPCPDRECLEPGGYWIEDAFDEVPEVITVWKTASAKKPASHKQKITLAPRRPSITEAFSLEPANGKLVLPSNMEMMKENNSGKISWGKPSGNLESAEWVRLKPTAKATKPAADGSVGYTGLAASWDEVMYIGLNGKKVQYADFGVGGMETFDEFYLKTLMRAGGMFYWGDGSQDNPFVCYTPPGGYGFTHIYIPRLISTKTTVTFENTVGLDASEFEMYFDLFYLEGDPVGKSVEVKYAFEAIRTGGYDEELYFTYIFEDLVTCIIQEYIDVMRHVHGLTGSGVKTDPLEMTAGDLQDMELNALFRRGTPDANQVIEIEVFPNDGVSKSKSFWVTLI